MRGALRLFLPPTFADDEKTRVAHILYWLVMFVIALAVLDLLLLAIFAPETGDTFWVNELQIVINLFILWLSRRGYVAAASLIAGLTGWALISLYLSVSGGVTSPAFPFMTLLIIWGGVLLGARGAVFFGLLSIATSAALFIAGEQGALTLMESPPTPSRLFATNTAIFFGLAGMMAFSARSVWSALSRARQGERTLAERNAQLEAEIALRERAQQQRARLADILEATSDFVGMTDSEGHTLYVNQAGRRVVGLAEMGDVTDTVMTDYHPPDVGAAILYAAVPAAVENGTWSGETVLRTVDGRDIPVSQVIIAHKNTEGKVEYFSTIMRDLTEQWQAEKSRLELALQQERLEAFKTFLSEITHDFRTPMTTISIGLYLLEKLDKPEDRQARMAAIRAQITLLNQYIEDLLTLSRLDHMPQLAFESVDVNDLLRELKVQLTPVAESKRQVLKVQFCDTAANLLVDRKDLLRALTNLTSNALHYTPDGGSVTLSAFEENAGVRIQIADTGVGIAPEQVSHIFERFYRASGGVKLRESGTGLGLAIVKRIIEVHGGTITVESKVGLGTTFRLWLPTEPQG